MTPDLPGTALPADLTDTPTSQGGPHPAYQALLAQDVLGFQACGACGRASDPMYRSS